MKMKKTAFFAIAALFALVSCSKEQVEFGSENGDIVDMTLNASIEQTKASFTDWHFAFTKGDRISLNNTYNVNEYFTLTFDGGKFKGNVKAPAKAKAPVTWYAYYPSHTVSLANQAGTLQGAAKTFVYSGEQKDVDPKSTTLNITLKARTSVLVIKNEKRAGLDINVKSDGKWLTGFGKNLGSYAKSDRKASLFTTSNKAVDTYYVVVPAGIKLAVYDGNKLIKETKDAGLEKGKYYNITILSEYPADAVQGKFSVGKNKYVYIKAENASNSSTYRSMPKPTDNWRLPTEAEWEYLLKNSQPSWSTSTPGFYLTSNTGEKAFFPANAKDNDGVTPTCEYWAYSTGYNDYKYYKIKGKRTGVTWDDFWTSSRSCAVRFVKDCN